jgi:hypothetical protein
MELLRRAAEAPNLNAFKAFPDLEPNEYLMYDVTSHGIVGLQVKALTFRGDARGAYVSVYRPALRPSPRTWFVIFSATEDEVAFTDHCLVLPSTVVAEHLAGHEVEGQLYVTRRGDGRLAPWRVPLAGLGRRLAQLAAEAD